MTDYQRYINALRKCAKEHENDRTSIGHIIVSDLCRDTANLLETLEQEPTTKNDLGVDCIDRQATLDAIIKRLGIKNETYLLEAERVIYQQILAMPSVTPQEPKTGHWIKTPKSVMGEGYMWYCNKCEHQVYQDSSRPYPSEKYCPNCGAKMVKPQESEKKDD